MNLCKELYKMEIDANILQYLIGNKFSNGLEFTVSNREKRINFKVDYLEEMVRGKNIIHLGCVDHLPLIQDKIARNIWLHARLVKSANRCLGIDLNKEGVEFLRNQLHYKDVVCCDILENDQVIKKTNGKWDHLVLGELLEHIDNPVNFLKRLKEKYSHDIEEVIITVPNALKYKNFKNVIRHKEVINSDHRYWFTPFTLCKVVICAGLQIEECQFIQSAPFPKENFLKNFAISAILKRFPAFRDTIILIAKFG